MDTLTDEEFIEFVESFKNGVLSWKTVYIKIIIIMIQFHNFPNQIRFHLIH